MSLLTVKIFAAFSIFAVAVIGGVIPLVAARYEASRRFFSRGNAFAGGVFLGAGLLHLLPESAKKLEQIVVYPLAPLLAGAGLCLMLLIDRVMFDSREVANRLSGERRQPIYPYVLLTVLSIHSVIAGISLGLESRVSTATVILVGILLHKGSAAFALMVSAHSAGVEEGRSKGILALFVLMTPLGIVLGSLASGFFSGTTAILVEGSCCALASGTFIYVAIVDIIDAELPRRGDRTPRLETSAQAGTDDGPGPTGEDGRLSKFGLIAVGVAFMAVMARWG